MTLPPNPDPKSEARAQWLLEHPEEYPGLPTHEHVQVLLRIWSFKAHLLTSWAVLASGAQLFLRRVAVVFNDHSYGCESNLDEHVFEKLCAQLSGISVPAFSIEESLVLDGTTYGIEMSRSVANVKLSWVAGGHSGWDELSRWHRRTTELFESMLPESTPKIEGFDQVR